MKTFSSDQLTIVREAASMAEELVHEHHRLSGASGKMPRYDLRTLAELQPHEIADGPFAQVIRYEARPTSRILGSATFDFYTICLQDHRILEVMEEHPKIQLFPFILYLVVHELIHIARFGKFLQYYEAGEEKRLAEEKRVHEITRSILDHLRLDGLSEILAFSDRLLLSIDQLAITRRPS
ncbi:MAG: hypothetical protein AB1547_14495 [Thermodesulfobacteriota bacterium]